MIRTLAWKEYREQRALWLAIAILAALLALNFGLLARGGISGMHDDVFVRDIVIGGLSCLMVAQGVVCGAQLLAGEKEPATLPFLDFLSSQRGALWRTKLIVGGLLTLAQAVVLYGLMSVLQLGSWTEFPSLVAAGWLALLWGMVGGAVCKHVFPAMLTGIVLAVGSILLLIIVPIGREAALIVAAVVAMVISRRSFCATDRQRRLSQDLLQGVRRARGPHSWQTLVWLAEKQGRWIIWPGLGLSFLAGFVTFAAPEFLWPAATLIIGLVCGNAVFAPENTGAQERFLGAQRFPAGRIWLIKTVFWALVAAGITTVLWLAIRPSFVSTFFLPDQGSGLFLTMWVLYGFCFGQFCALLSCKIVVTWVLGFGSSLLILAFWLPSLILGGMTAWQILPIPMFLLLAARLNMWSWFSGRLFSRWHCVGLIGCCMAAFLWLAGSLWNRALEIPQVGKPFDLKAFEAKLNRAAQSEAALLIRRGANGLGEQRTKVRAKLGPATRFLFPLAHNPKQLPDYLGRDYLSACPEILSSGWPEEDREIGRWMDALFAGDWVDDFRAVEKMPLGLMVDPRKLRLNLDPSQLPSSYREREAHNWPEVGALFSARALQLQVRGDFGAALENLATSLALSRQLRHCAPCKLAMNAARVEGDTLDAFDKWLHKIGPQPALLRKALAMLQRHESESPDQIDNIKADYIVTRNNPAGLYLSISEMETSIIQLALEAPWERERNSRLVDALFQGKLRLAMVVTRTGKSAFEMDPNLSAGGEKTAGLFLVDGDWTREQWGRLQGEVKRLVLPGLGVFVELGDLGRLRARQVYIALMLYQIDNGRAPAKLDDLVPHYLPTLPLDPWRNQPFQYRVSPGEEITGTIFNDEEPRTEKLRAGQGLLWLEESLDFVDPKKIETWHFPVPVWTRK